MGANFRLVQMKKPTKRSRRPGGLSEETMAGIGERIHGIRLRLDRSERNFATALGVAPETLAAWEHGRGIDREAVNLIAQSHVPDGVWKQVKPHFTPEEIVDLTLLVSAINAWNRFAIAFRKTPA